MRKIFQWHTYGVFDYPHYAWIMAKLADTGVHQHRRERKVITRCGVIVVCALLKIEGFSAAIPADLSWFSIFFVRLAHLAGVGLDLGPIVPKLFLISFCPTQQNSSKGYLRLLTRNGSLEQ